MKVGTRVLVLVLCSAAFQVPLRSTPLYPLDSIKAKNLKVNSVMQDSLLMSDTIAVKKTAQPPSPLFTPLHHHGSIVASDELAWRSLRKQTIQEVFYTSFDDLIEMSVPIFPLSMGFYGQPTAWKSLGAGLRDNSLMLNGRQVNDLSLGAGVINQYSPEFMEQAQFFLGSSAVIFSDNASGIAVNLQEPVYNTKSPYTRIWFADGANGFIASDGIFSQNIRPNLNMTVGYRRQAADGRFQNQWLDAWNLRALLRWNPGERTSISLVENFTNHGYGANGGVNTSTSEDVNNEITANVMFPNLNQRVFRHDLSLNLSTQVSSDSTSLFQSSIYYSHALWNVGRDTSLIFNADSSRVVTWANARVGATAKLEQNFFKKVRMIVGADVEYQQSDSSVYNERLSRARLAAFAHARLSLVDNIAMSGGARLQLLSDRATLAVGANARMKLAPSWSLQLDISQSSRLPTAVEGWDLQQENSTLLYCELAHKDSLNSMSVLGFYRRTARAFEAAPVRRQLDSVITTSTYSNSVDDAVSFGLLLNASVHFAPFVCDGFVQTSLAPSSAASAQILPSLYGGLSLRYEYVLGRSVLFAGVNTRMHTSFSGEAFLPQNWSTFSSQTTQDLAFSGLDIIAGVKLGSAYVKLRFQNILSNSFSTLSTFPIPDRNLSISVAWTFFD